MLNENTTIGNYRIIKELARGASGIIYLAQHVHLVNRIVAIKLLNTTHLSSQQERDSFLREASFLELLKHPYVLPILDVGTHEGFPYIVAEYAPRGSLKDRIKAQLPDLFPAEEVLRILSQVGQALHAAHQRKIIHRDIKPANILFNANGDALLADFNIAMELEATRTQHGDTSGTPYYMAPEQFRGIVSKKSDQYALGCIAYELVTGHRPFNASEWHALAFKHTFETPIAPTHFRPQLSPSVEQAILKAMAKDRAERYDDVAAFITALGVPLPPQTPETRAFPVSQTIPPTVLTSHPSQSTLAPLEHTPHGHTPTPPPVNLPPPSVSQAHSTGQISSPGAGQDVQERINSTGPRTTVDKPGFLPMTHPPMGVSQMPSQSPGKRNTVRTIALLSLVVLLIPLAYFVFPYIQGKTSNPSPTPTVLPQLTGIGVIRVPNGEYIGISDGTFAFDTNRPDGELKRQSADKLQANDLSSADSLWQQAIATDTNDAETLIYLEDQRVLASGAPHITIVVGTTLTGDPSTVTNGRDNLQGAYVAQKEYNAQSKLPGGVMMLLLIANSGSNNAYTRRVAQQVVRLAQTDKTIVGVMGWTLSPQTINAIGVLGPAKIPMVASSPAGDSLTGTSPYFFRVAAPAMVQADIGAQYAERTLHVKTAAVFIDIANDYSRSLADDFARRFTDDGDTIVATENYTVGKSGTILPRLLQNALSKHPDLIYFAGYPPDASVLLAHLQPSDPPMMGGNALYELGGYSTAARTGLSHLHMVALAYPDEWDVLGLSAQKPAFFNDYISAFDPHKQHTNYGYDRADSNVILSYDAMLALLHGSSIALTAKSPFTSSDLQPALRQITGNKVFQGVSGQISLGPDGNPIDKAVALVCVDKAYHFKLDGVQGQFLVGGPNQTQFPASSVCS